MLKAKMFIQFPFFLVKFKNVFTGSMAEITLP